MCVCVLGHLVLQQHDYIKTSACLIKQAYTHTHTHTHTHTPSCVAGTKTTEKFLPFFSEPSWSGDDRGGASDVPSDPFDKLEKKFVPRQRFLMLLAHDKDVSHVQGGDPVNTAVWLFHSHIETTPNPHQTHPRAHTSRSQGTKNGYHPKRQSKWAVSWCVYTNNSSCYCDCKLVLTPFTCGMS